MTARVRTHIRFCPDKQCVIESGDVGDLCKKLDHLLDHVEQETLQRVYRSLLDLHMGTLLQNGPDAAGGLALAIGVVHGMLPDEAMQAALAEWAEWTPGEQT